MVSTMRRVAAISAAPRSANPRGRRAFNRFCLGSGGMAAPPIAPGAGRQAAFLESPAADTLISESLALRPQAIGSAATRRPTMSLANFRDAAQTVPNDLESYWIGFTPNRAFKKAPRLIVRAKDMHYYRPRSEERRVGKEGRTRLEQK